MTSGGDPEGFQSVVLHMHKYPQGIQLAAHFEVVLPLVLGCRWRSLASVVTPPAAVGAKEGAKPEMVKATGTPLAALRAACKQASKCT